MNEPLRIGFLLGGFMVPAWQADLVDAVGSEPGLARSLLLVSRPGRPPGPAPAVLGAYDAGDRLLDRGRNGRIRPVALESGTTPVLDWAGGAHGGDQGLDADLRARIGDLDLLIDLGAHGLDSEWPSATRLGLWTLRFGDDPTAGGRLPQLWEVMEPGTHVTATLEARGPDGARHALGRAVCGAHPYSLLRTRCVIAAAAVNLMIGRLRALRDLGPSLLARPPREPEPASAPRPCPPGGMRLAGMIATCGLRVLKRIWDKAVRDDFYWAVAVAPRPPGTPLEAVIAGAAFRELPQRADWFHADPFVFEHEGRAFLFVEAFPYATGRGVIAVSRLEADGSASPPEVVLERPCHLSYPHVFTWRDGIYMIPETSGNRTVELYRCERFPDRWVLDTVLMKGVEATDTTILDHGGRLWMFVNLASRGLWPDTELHLFHSVDLRGPWRPHPLNPVVLDVRRARPAGPIWEEGGRLIRPAQDCSPGYASAVSFQRITHLTPEDYAEEPVTRLAAEGLRWRRGARRTHHWCMGARFVTNDATVSRLRLPARLRA